MKKNSMKKIIIAIDGPAGSGKTSTAKELAKLLNYVYLDTGAMYRAVALAWLNYLNGHNLNPAILIEDKAKNNLILTELMANIKIDMLQKDGNLIVLLNNENISSQIRDILVTKYSSPISAYPIVRTKLIDQQRELGKSGGVVMDGRDIGTVVFPDAELKIFLVANLEARTERRYKELLAKGVQINKDELKAEIAERDNNDTHRTLSPLVPAKDAIEIDTSELTFEEQIQRIYKLFETKILDNV